MQSADPIILQEYARIRSCFDFDLLGLLDIGSHARGEAVTMSDRDLRVVVQSAEPYTILQEHVWTQVAGLEVSTVDWADLNAVEGVTFGITNLSYVERCLQSGRYPLNDHTCIYQGQILDDEGGVIGRFRDRYAGVAFDNIIPDYFRQTDWRVNDGMAAELESATLGQGLDRRKLAVPFVHTCCRIVRDIANIDTYRRHASYVQNVAGLDAYYGANWPWFYPSFRALFDYKTVEVQRRTLFEKVERRDPAYHQMLQTLSEHTVQLWGHFKQGIVQA